MSEPIIIEIPSPTCRARFVLVHVGQCSGATCGIPRDATPDDLARGGYVPSVGYLPRREVETAVSDAMDLQRRLDRMTEVAEQNRERFETAETELSADTIRADAWKAKAIKAEADLGVAESANEEAGELLAAETARAENAEGLLIQRETELRLAREDGDERARDLRQAYERAVAAAEKAERERDEALLRAHTGVVHYEILRQSGEEAARQRDEARAELARLTAPGEGSEGGPWRAYGEPTDQELVDAFEHAYRNAPSVRTHATAIRTIYRLGVAHERARQQPEKGRAKDEELVDLYRKVYETHGGGTIDVSHDDCRRAAVLAVAAHVRKERCLVAQAVGMGAGVTASRTSERVPGTTGIWDVYATRRPDVPGEHYAYGVPTADVAATLARLLGEVSRG